jgi:hypothetical protein
MLGYIFLTENSANGKKYLGKRQAVSFDRKYFGDTDSIKKDLDEFGPNVFSVKMLRAVEDIDALDYIYQEFLDSHAALTDPIYYNCETAEAPKKKTVRRKKKVEDE